MPRLAANLSFFFTERPFLERFRAAAQCGFSAVEFMFAGDGGYHHDASAVSAELQRHGLQQTLLNASAGNWGAGERGLGGLPGRDADFKTSIEHGLRFAEVVGCRRMHVLAGLATHGADEAVLVQRLRWACEVANTVGVDVLVEPLNPVDFPGYLVPDADAALSVIDQVGTANCKLQLDLYHLARSLARGADGASGSASGDLQHVLASEVRRLLPHAGHVQLANPPGRHEPGQGDVAFAPLLALLDELGYAGHVGCEYKPHSPRHLDWAAPFGIRSPPPSSA